MPPVREAVDFMTAIQDDPEAFPELQSVNVQLPGESPRARVTFTLTMLVTHRTALDLIQEMEERRGSR